MTDMTATGKMKLTLNRGDICEDFVIESNETRHILVLVPGTTDPVNINEKITGKASAKYWDKAFLDGMKEFVGKYTIKKYIPQFAWSGDNEIKERIKAGEQLLIWVKNATHEERYNNIPLYVHFIGHSHGGNVINEFTKLAAKDSEFTDNIKVRSIVYLSTPFFTKQAQIDTSVLHEKCKIINVFNKYDLTQRFVANFSMRQMPALISAFENDKPFNDALKNLAEAPYLKMTAFLASIPSDKEEYNDILPRFKQQIPVYLLGKGRRLASFYTGPELWEAVLDVFNNIVSLIDRILIILERMNQKYPRFITKEILKNLSDKVFQKMRGDLAKSTQNLQGRLLEKKSDYTLNYLVDDVGEGVGDFINTLNTLLEFRPKDYANTSGLRSNLSDIIGNILINQIESFDDTRHKPDYQFNTTEARKNGQYEIVHIDITNKDPYHKCAESKNYNVFIEKMEKLEERYDVSNQKGSEGANIRAEIVFNLLAQENYGVFNLLDIMLMWMGSLTKGSTEELINETRVTITKYSEKLAERDNHIIHHDLGKRSQISYYVPYGEELDIKYRKVKRNIVDSYFTTPFGSAKGGIPYLAVESHSVSRRKLLHEVKTAWSELMPKYGFTSGYKIKRECYE